MNVTSALQLNNGTRIPQLGLGVYRSPAGETTRAAIRAALECGYRHIDTARIYGNESDVGTAVRASGIPRSELFITTKLWNEDQGFDETLRAFEKSMDRLGLEYVDLYLVHWPVAHKRRDSWRALEAISMQGRAKAIGVSNYMSRHLRELLNESDTVPAVNQIELSPYNYRSRLDTLELCATHSIAVEAYSPLTKGYKLGDTALLNMAGRHGKTAAQILLRWALQKGFVVIPKSIHAERIRENADLYDFALSPEEMDTLDKLDENLSTGWDPTNAP